MSDACHAAEQRYGLTRTPPCDRTAARRPTRAQDEKAARQGRAEAPRITLRRHAATAAAAASTEAEYFGQLQRAGVMVRLRYSTRTPGQVTGYAIALPGDTGRDGQPVWYGGGRLAADLTLPRLRARWHPSRTSPGLDGAERNAVWDHAASTAAGASAAIRDLSGADPASASDIAWAAADMLRAASSVLGSPALRQAADAYDRAARQPWGRLPPPSPAGNQLRSAARLLSAVAYASRDRPLAHIALVVRLVALAEAVGELRAAQQHAAQASAALAAARQLRAAATPPGPAGPPPPRPRPGRLPAGGRELPRRAGHPPPTAPARRTASPAAAAGAAPPAGTQPVAGQRVTPRRPRSRACGPKVGPGPHAGDPGPGPLCSARAGPATGSASGDPAGTFRAIPRNGLPSIRGSAGLVRPGHSRAAARGHLGPVGPRAPGPRAPAGRSPTLAHARIHPGGKLFRRNHRERAERIRIIRSGCVQIPEHDVVSPHHFPQLGDLGTELGHGLIGLSVAEDGCNDGPLALHGVDQPLAAQDLHRRTHGSRRNGVVRGQRSDRPELVAGHQPPRPDLLADLRCDLQVRHPGHLRCCHGSQRRAC